MEFDLPVSLVQLLAKDATNSRLRSIVDHTMDLSTALAWGLSRRTSKKHAGNYTFYMERYIRGIALLYPDYSLKPNHHYALHIPDNLKFGPLKGTWAYPLERMIGRLQKIKTNTKLGSCLFQLFHFPTELMKNREY